MSSSDPKSAPLPADDPGRSAPDSQGVRKYDVGDVKSHGVNAAAAKERARTAPRCATLTPITSSAPVNDHRRVSATNRPTPVRHPGLNVYIPSFGMMYYIMIAMLNKVSSLPPYGDTGAVSDWIPHVSLVVYSILAYVQVLRAQQAACKIRDDRSLFLDQFKSWF